MSTQYARAAFSKLGSLGNVNISKGDVISLGLDAHAGIGGYSGARKEGRGKASSLLQGVTDAFLVNVVGPKLYYGAMIATAAPKFAVKQAENINMQARSMSRSGMNKPFINSTFVDNEQVYTMRQAGMAMAQQSKYNLQHAMLGNEAKYLHR